jgi:hypothetical protein
MWRRMAATASRCSMPRPNPVKGPLVAALGAVAALATAAAAFAVTGKPAGSVHQPAGKIGCYTEDGSSEAGPATCHKIRGGTEATTLAVSPDGRFAYLVGYGNHADIPPVLSIFKRNAKSGSLKQLPAKSGCFSRDGSSAHGPDTCSKARDLDTGDAISIVISRDGRFLFVASQYDDGANEVGGIAIFARNLNTGKLRQLAGSAGCVVAVAYENCTVVRDVEDVSNLHFTPDQKFLYASNYAPRGGIAIFRFNSKTGALRQLKGKNGCITVDGTTLTSYPQKVCRAMPNFNLPWDVATPDNRFAYVASSLGLNLVQAFKRNSHGGLVPLTGAGSCVSDTGTSPAGPCVTGRGLYDAERIVASKNGRYLYTGGYSFPSPVAVLNRNPKTGALSQRSGKAACISADGSSGDGSTCRVGRALNGTYAGALSPNGRTLYYSEFYANSLVIFRVSPRTGAFKQLSGKPGCVTADGSSDKGPHTCQKARAVEGAYQVTLASHSHDVYLSASNSNGVALFYARK